jgi:hypothetical protein
MLRLPLIAATVLSAVVATLTSAQDNAPITEGAQTFAAVTDIEWSYAAEARDVRGEPYLRFSRDGMNTTMGAGDLPEAAVALARASSAAPGEPVAFGLAREAGVMACTGSVTAPGRAGGRCRFDPDAGFVAALAARGLVPEDVEDLLGLAFVDARLASVEELSSAGFAVADVDELTAVAALEVTGAYAAELRGAGLEPEDLDELVSAKAVGVEPGWIAEMAEAGYPGLDLDKAIELRALGVTPDYARRMARVMRAMEGVE